MITATLKSSNVNTENSYLTHFHIANQNLNLFLTEEIHSLMKRNFPDKIRRQSANFQSRDMHDLKTAGQGSLEVFYED